MQFKQVKLIEGNNMVDVQQKINKFYKKLGRKNYRVVHTYILREVSPVIVQLTYIAEQDIDEVED